MRVLLHYGYAFLTDGLGLVLMLLPFYLLGRLLYLAVHKDKTLAGKIQPDREVLLLAFFVFLVLLFTQTFVVNSGRNELRLVPLNVITTQIAQMHDSPETVNEFLFNVVGNIGIFVPVGWFAAAIFRRNLVRTAGIGLLLSLCIEVGQLPLDRTTDVDDLILNTTGAVLGYGLYRLLIKLSGAFRRK